MPSQATASDDWYEVPVYYDIIFSADNELECDFLQAVFARYGSGRLRRILEPACGSGRLVEALAHRGFSVHGFDRSEAMLRFAKDRLEDAGLRARLERGEMADFDLGGDFDLAHCLVSTFKYLLDEKSAHAHLACVARALRPGGLYVLGFHLSDYDDPACSRERWYGQRDGTHVVCNIQSWPPDRRRRIERVRSRLNVRPRRGKPFRLQTDWQFRSYNAAQARRLLRSVPELEHVATYDFTYDLARSRSFSDEQLDCVLILRRCHSATKPRAATMRGKGSKGTR